MRLGSLLALLGMAQVFLAIVYGQVSWWIAGFLTWSGVSFLMAGLAYLRIGPRLFGKGPKGSLSFPLTLLNLPYLLLSRLI